MMRDPLHHCRLTDYLLRELPAWEAEELEEAYVTDAGLFRRLAREERALVKAYVGGRLPAERARRFERTYLASESRRRRVEALRLRRRVASAPAARPSPDDGADASWAWLVAAVLLAGLVSLGAERLSLRSPPPGPPGGGTVADYRADQAP